MSLISRRSFVSALAALPVLSMLPRPALALSPPAAESLVDKAVAEINQAIAAGGSEAAIIDRFVRIFARYADESYIAAYAMGPAARQASAAQRQAFSQAFRSYITAKYGRRFREFVGGTVTVSRSKAVKTWVEVYAQVNLPGEAPFAVTFYVSDRTGQPLFFNIAVEGVSMLLQEREEIGAMLDQNRGNIDAVIAQLRQAT
ncbi:ABC transporter substrate-binding protein [Psychromarinibacter sp. C21-152]|uniref:ABC transporter substrate-binding protein n=1 Tax=Psychromarinibacter sediminicola TaxID=3033385 RepID=A0AAE3T776_9RHOB|nr:ABC transporter substrate-binding protein [Psychromarinibacter sediminicola]MDF0599348.1 ABC transporter substrate-binding protein [Psychromarinibacter sediminicola]